MTDTSYSAPMGPSTPGRKRHRLRAYQPHRLRFVRPSRTQYQPIPLARHHRPRSGKRSGASHSQPVRFGRSSLQDRAAQGRHRRDPKRSRGRHRRRNGFSEVIAIQNASGNGIDLVGRSLDGRIVFFEVKSSRVGNIGDLSSR